MVAAAERRGDLVASEHALVHGCGSYQLLRIGSRALAACDRVVLILAGLHGDEIAGPLTLAQGLASIVERAHGSGLGIIVYPLVNPSGFDAGTRYNGDHDRGTAGNGDFLRYVLDDGTLADEVPPSSAPHAWRWSSDTGVALPAETRLLHTLLRQDPLDRVVAAIDLHQDLLTTGVGPAAYAYAFGDTAVYREIVSRVRALVPLLANRTIGAGFGVEIDERGAAVRAQSAGAHPTSDADGFVVRHDGSLTDLMYRVGARYSVAVETTGAVPLEVACQVNRVWIEGLIDLAANCRR